MLTAKKYVLKKYFDGFPKFDDLQLVEEQLLPLQDKEYLVEAIYISVDPYQTVFCKALKIGSTFAGEQVGKVIESRSTKFPVGSYVLGTFGWRNYTISSENEPTLLNFPAPAVLPDMHGLPVSLAIGALGTPGFTAYFGFLEICKPQEGDTVVVTAAAGAVGCHVGQIAKIKGCHVIGVTGCDKKGKLLTEKYGFDYYINYKKPLFADTLKKYAHQGIDCYFDNVGGELSSTIMSHMNSYGRVSVCGAVSTYNAKGDGLLAPAVQLSIILKQLKVEGFMLPRWSGRFAEAFEQNLQWVMEGKIKFNETITEGFEHVFQAFIDMLQGKNIGKAIVKV